MSDQKTPEFSGLADGQLAALIRGGSAEAFVELMERYIPMIRAKVSPFRADGVETDDLCQEGLLALHMAAKTFDPAKGASFRRYAEVCISNRVITVYRAATDGKNRPLNNFVSLNEEGAPEFPDDGSADPETLLDCRESFEAILRRMREVLTPMELRALRLFLGGCSYQQIAKKMSVTEKAADNALQRARGKLRDQRPPLTERNKSRG